MRDINKYTENYLDLPFENIQDAYRKQKVIEVVEKYMHSNILEIGCGMDPFFNCFQNFDQLVIVEPSNLFCENAINIIRSSDVLTSKVVVINDYLENTANELKKYDFEFVILSGLLQEIENPSLLLEKLRSFIKADTIVHVNVANANSFHRLLAYEMGLIDSTFKMSPANVLLQQQRVFDLSTLSDLIISHGFEIIDSGSLFIKPFTHKQMAQMLEHNILNEKILDGLYKMTKYMPNMGSEIYVNFRLK